MILIPGIFAVILLICLLWPDGCLRLLARLFPRFLWAEPHSANRIALTFDDGPDPIATPALLEILKAHRVRATFFLIGVRASAHPELVRRIRDEGHEIGNHGFSAGPAVLLSLRNFQHSLEETGAAIGQCRFYRPGVAFLRPAQRRLAESLGYRCVLGSAYAFDPHNPPVGYLVWAIRPSLRSGAIVALHDAGGDRSRTLRAVPLLIEEARRRELTFVTLSELSPCQTRREGLYS